MERILAGIVIVPGIVALLLFLVFTYLYQQSRQGYFRAWQVGWGAYCLYYALVALDFYAAQPSAILYLLSYLLLVGMAMCIFISTRLIQETFRLLWYDYVLAGALSAVAVWNMLAHFDRGVFRFDIDPQQIAYDVGVFSAVQAAQRHTTGRSIGNSSVDVAL